MVLVSVLNPSMVRVTRSEGKRVPAEFNEYNPSPRNAQLNAQRTWKRR